MWSHVSVFRDLALSESLKKVSYKVIPKTEIRNGKGNSFIIIICKFWEENFLCFALNLIFFICPANKIRILQIEDT